MKKNENINILYYTKINLNYHGDLALDYFLRVLCINIRERNKSLQKYL